jgi:Fur family ferric uptake transcriptional regulator
MSKPKSRITRQRQAILEELEKADSHPTADEIYQKVRKKLPRISLGTVYRNLEILSDSGIVKKVDVCASQKRYDGRPELHYHASCIHCGRVDDLPGSSRIAIEDVFRDVCDYHITGYQLVLFGLCPECKNT